MYKIIGGGLLFFIALFVVQVMPVQAAEKQTVATSSVLTATSTQVAIEKQVREYFADIPVMIEIARCESKFRQFTDSGAVLRGGAGGGMVGVFQFFESIHATPALKLGFDLKTIEGNLGYARHVYTESGSTPWKSCMPTVVPVHNDATLKVRIELLTKLVGLLQQLLALQQQK
jgi:hypothetical protein